MRKNGFSVRSLIGKSVVLAVIVTLSGSVKGGSSQAGASWSPGPRVFFVGLDLAGLRVELLSAAPNGGAVRRLAGGGFLGTVKPPFPEFAPPSWSADGRLMAFVGARRGASQVFLSAGGDRAPRPVPNTRRATIAVLSPDGETIAFSRLNIRVGTTSILLYDRIERRLRRLTPARPRLHLAPSSFSADGARLAVSAHDPRRGYRALGIDLATGRRQVLARRATSPALSPDGTRLAYISFRDRQRQAGTTSPAGELYVRRLPGGKGVRLTRTRRQSEATPSWDPAGARIAYSQTTGPLGFLGLSDRVMQINADGSCRRTLFPPRRPDAFATYLRPAWQPGPGREAGRINC